jgi:histidyl-tRNA synthetase
MIKAITGVKDALPSDISKWRMIEETVRNYFNLFNYKEIRTPIFEETALFKRGIGEETDIVGKEMYTFLDRSKTSLTLKPEMTASVVRAFIEHSLGSIQPLNKLFYISPMFRQEKPQAGRYRQFHQFGAEALGCSSPFLDAEMIQIAYDILTNFGLKNLTVKINSIGVPESREAYKTKLKEYLADKTEQLSEESQKRFETNILRILDSKDERDQKLLEGAPIILDYLDEKSKDDFELVKQALALTGLPYEIDPKLVRGLDYYTNTTFEIVSNSVGSQSALCGGGRYDLLIGLLGGKPTPGVGFAAGIERIILACENEGCFNLPEDSIDFYIVRLDKELTGKAYEYAAQLRRSNYVVELDYSEKSVKAQMREANKCNCKYALFVGGEEFKEGKAGLKNMQNGEQQLVSLENLVSEIKTLSEK